MSTALALRLEFAMRSLEIASLHVEHEPAQVQLRVELMRKLVDQAIEELSS